MADPDPSVVDNDHVVEKYRDYVTPIWKSLNVPIRRASGCTIEDFEGNEYLDVFSGISVTNAGHRNEAVLEAAKTQLDEFVHGCSYLHPNQPVADLAERVAEVAPGDLRKSFFCNSGTEAVEGAIKLARKYTGSKEIVSLEMAFHGRTLGSLALTANHTYKHGMAPTINDVVNAPAPYQYRSPYRDLPEEEYADRAVAEMRRVIDTHSSRDIAAIVVEPVMGEGGIIVPPSGYLRGVKELAHDYDALFVVDEVQSGYGRTGEMWAVDHFDVTPDILAQAKGIANGFPLGAFTAPDEIADAFESGDHFSTYGGNPVLCAAALAAIDEYEDGLVDNARSQGERLSDELVDLEDEFDEVGEARGLGLMHGVELVDPDRETDGAPDPDADLAKLVGERLREEHGVVVGVGGFYNNVVRLQPPLSIDGDQLDRAVDAFRDTLERVR